MISPSGCKHKLFPGIKKKNTPSGLQGPEAPSGRQKKTTTVLVAKNSVP
jgi:hypothetical protein